jgi:hypothetical protein
MPDGSASPPREPEQGSDLLSDDPEILDDEILYRRLPTDDRNWLVKDAITGKPVRPASGAFQPDSDGLSVYRHSVLVAQDPPLGPPDVAVTQGNIIVSFTAAQVRSISLGIKKDAWPQDVPDPEHPRNAAHALVIGWAGLGKKARIRRQKEFAELSLKFVHPQLSLQSKSHNLRSKRALGGGCAGRPVDGSDYSASRRARRLRARSAMLVMTASAWAWIMFSRLPGWFA